jgi:hypothetical protein
LIPIDPFGPLRPMPDPVGFGLALASRTGVDIRKCVGTIAAGCPHAEPGTNWDDAADRPNIRADRVSIPGRVAVGRRHSAKRSILLL